MFGTLSDTACVAMVPKSGIQSIGTAVSQNAGEFLSNEQALIYEVRVMFIRYWKDRLLSLASHIYWMERVGDYDYSKIAPKELFEGKSQQESYEGLIDHILENQLNPDEHWEPQMHQVKFRGEVVPNIFYKFNDIAETWGKYTEGAFPWNNKHTHIKVTDYKLDELKVFYSQDIKAWENVNGNNN